MFKLTFVILHYIVIEDTIECVESMLNNIDDNFNIVIVDNGSPNKSGEILRKKYAAQKRVHVILNKDNDGFARGNNVGYRFAKIDLKSNFIVLINNDTVIKQHDFVELVISKYKQVGFHVMGPDVISMIDNGHQNPQRIVGLSKKELVVNSFLIVFFLILNYLRIEGYVRRIKRFINKSDKPKKVVSYKCEQLNVQLHGSCLIFSPKFIEIFEGLCEKTFMYMEEDILNFQLRKSNLISFYTPDLTIYHKEDSSTNVTHDLDFMKRRFKYKNVLKSSKVLFELMCAKKIKG